MRHVEVEDWLHVNASIGKTPLHGAVKIVKYQGQFAIIARYPKPFNVR